MAQILQISDGINTIDLLDPNGNYHLAEWIPTINQFKDGGIYTNNSLVDGSYPIFRSINNAEESIKIHVTGTSQSNVISNMRALFTLLDKSINYFIDNATTPVYMIIKSDTEINSRYGLITGYRIEKLPPQFSGPFVLGGKQTSPPVSYTSIYADIELVILRREFTSLPPGTSTRATIGNQVSYNGINFGINSTATENIFVKSHSTLSNLTHIYHFDVSGSSWSGNLINNSTPFNLLPSGPGVGDILYIGTDTTLSNSGPFNNVIFNIGQTISSGIVGIWEYYNGSTWSALTVQNNTKANGDSTGVGFDTTGVKVLSFLQPSNWSTRNLNTEHGGSAPNITGYWIRYRLTTVVGSTVPQQQIRGIYSVTVPYIDLPATDINGDIPSLSKIRIIDQTLGAAIIPDYESIIIGRRLYSRGSNFNAYINISDEQNTSGITVTPSGSFVNNIYAPTGRSASITLSPSNLWSPAFNIVFDSTIANHYYGRYRLFVAASKTGTTETKIRVVCGNVYSQTGTVTDTPTGRDQIVDLGIITLPPGNILNTGEVFDSFTLSCEVYTNSSDVVTFWELILIPIDESVVEVRRSGADATDTMLGRVSGALNDPRYIDIDNTSNIGKTAFAPIRRTSNNNVVGSWTTINGAGLHLAQDRARYWFLTTSYSFGDEIIGDSVLEIGVYKNDRYLLPIG